MPGEQRDSGRRLAGGWVIGMCEPRAGGREGGVRAGQVPLGGYWQLRVPVECVSGGGVGSVSARCGQCERREKLEVLKSEAGC